MTLLLSTVVVSSKDFPRIERTVHHLQRQTIAEQIELIIVAARPMPAAQSLSGFGAVRVITVGYIDNVDTASVDGILAASAPYISVVEDHAYPEPTWAERVVAAFGQSAEIGVVGSQMGNANPNSGLSWANLLIAYGPQTATRSQTVKSVPSHNSSFRADLVQPLGTELYGLVGRGGRLMKEIREQGAVFHHAGDARLTHANPSRLRSSADLRFNAGRAYATQRSKGWSLPKRVAFALGSPLFPLLRLRLFYNDYFASGRVEKRLIPALLLALAFDAAGQAVGYLLGAGRSGDVLATFEMGRMQHLTAGDKAALRGGGNWPI